MNNRRKLIVALGASALATPLAGFAQQATKVWRIGYLSAASSDNDKLRLAAFQQGLRQLGYLEGKNIVIEQRYAAGRFERLADLATELVRLQVDVLIVYGDSAIRAAREAGGAIPIVMTISADPVGEGFVDNLARPGGRVTGFSDLHSALVTKRLELLKEIAPSASRIAVLLTADPTRLRQLKDIQAAAPAFGVIVLPLPVTGADDIDRAFVTMRKERSEGLIVLGDPVIAIHRRQIAGLAAKGRLPSIFTVRESVDAGGLMSYGTNFPELWRRAAIYVDKILKGAKPADLPVEQASKFELVVNLKTAKALGIAIPQSILIRANEVIQ
jgi:putative ABC transport system substrate-binding protein